MLRLGKIEMDWQQQTWTKNLEHMTRAWSISLVERQSRPRQTRGAWLPEKLGEGVRPSSQNPYPI